MERSIEGVGHGEELLPYVGPAAALPLFGALARLPHAAAERLWSGLLALACGILVLASLALARVRRVSALLAAFAFVIASGPGTSAFALGQAAFVAGAGIAAALYALERRALAAAALAMLAAAIQPNLLPPLLARMRDRAALVAGMLAAVAFGALTLAGGGIAGVGAYLRRLAEHGAAERFVTIQHTPAAIARAFGAPPTIATAVGLALAAAAIAATIVVTARRRLGPLDGTLLALTALPFAVPFFHEHDFLVELVPLLVVAVGTRGAGRVAAGVASALIGVDWLGLAQRPAADGQIVVLGCALAFAFVVLGRGTRGTRADLAPFVSLGVLACIAVPLAHAHPAPTWPDALPPAYRAPAHADASAVWADEQRAGGLDAQDPVWAALRSLPLAGCVVLGAAVALRRSSG